MNKVFLTLLFLLCVTQAPWAQNTTKPRLHDPNAPVSALGPGVAVPNGIPRADIAALVFEQAMATQAQTDPNLCAIVVLPGPATSFDIRFGVFNVAADRLDFLIMNSFRALRGQSLLHQSVFDTVGPLGGTVNVEYPLDESGKGPVVLSFTDFKQFESAAFNTDPDTYNDPDFGATVLDMDRTVIELVYSSDIPSSRRCRGTLKFDATLNTAIANIVQVFP